MVTERASSLDGIRPVFHEVKKRQRKELLTEYLRELNHEVRRVQERRKELVLERRRVAVRVWVNAQVFPDDPDRWLNSRHPISMLEDDLQQLVQRESDVNSLIQKLRALLDEKPRLVRKEPAQ